VWDKTVGEGRVVVLVRYQHRPQRDVSEGQRLQRHLQERMGEREWEGERDRVSERERARAQASAQYARIFSACHVTCEISLVRLFCVVSVKISQIKHHASAPLRCQANMAVGTTLRPYELPQLYWECHHPFSRKWGPHELPQLNWERRHPFSRKWGLSDSGLRVRVKGLQTFWGVPSSLFARTRPPAPQSRHMRQPSLAAAGTWAPATSEVNQIEPVLFSDIRELFSNKTPWSWTQAIR